MRNIPESYFSVIYIIYKYIHKSGTCAHVLQSVSFAEVSYAPDRPTMYTVEELSALSAIDPEFKAVRYPSFH